MALFYRRCKILHSFAAKNLRSKAVARVRYHKTRDDRRLKQRRAARADSRQRSRSNARRRVAENQENRRDSRSNAYARRNRQIVAALTSSALPRRRRSAAHFEWRLYAFV